MNFHIYHIANISKSIAKLWAIFTIIWVFGEFGIVYSYSITKNSEQTYSFDIFTENLNANKIFSALNSSTNDNYSDNSTSLTLNDGELGFEFILPENRTNYQEAPQLHVEIQNSTIVKYSNYTLFINLTYSVYNFYNYNTTNTSSTFTQNASKNGSLAIKYFNNFNPLNNDNISCINNEIGNLWLLAGDSSEIIINVASNQTAFIYELKILKDLQPPFCQMGFFWTENHTIIPFDNSTNIFNSPPVLSLNITDNIANEITINYIVNNHFLSEKVNLKNNFIHNRILINKVLNLSLSKAFDNWEGISDGNLTGIFSLVDAAGNPSDWIMFSFIKDTTSPVFDSGIPDRSWVTIGDYALQDLENPIYKTIQIKERPRFNVILKDQDIESVGLQIHSNNLISYLSTSGSDQNTSTNISWIPKSSQPSDSVIYISGLKNGSVWHIEIPEDLWNLFGNEKINMDLEIIDFAGNVAIYSFSIMRLTNSADQSEFSLYFVISLLVFSFGTIMLFISISYHEIKIKHKTLESEKDFNKIDSDLLDLVLEPLNHFKLNQVTEIIDKEGKDCNLDAILPPDEQNFIKESVQLVDLNEIRLLLTRYPMKSIDIEEFIREMLSLSPKDRRDFLLRYMEDANVISYNNKNEITSFTNTDSSNVFHETDERLLNIGINIEKKSMFKKKLKFNRKKKKYKHQNKDELINKFRNGNFDQINKNNNIHYQNHEQIEYDSFLDEIEELTDEISQNIENEGKEHNDE